MIKEDYISFETAKLLKEKGFDVPVLQHYTKVGSLWRCQDAENFNKEKEIECYSAPTLQMAMKWLREEHRIYIAIEYDSMENSSGFFVFILQMQNHKGTGLDFYNSYEEAVEAALKYCLTKLIKK